VAHRERLLPVLEDARRRGFLGPGLVETHVGHTAGFAEVIRQRQPVLAVQEPAVDLGSGAGVPGLVLALQFPGMRWVLMDAARRRAAFLRAAVAELGLDGTVTVIEARAEEVGRRPEHRGKYQLAVARGFGPAAVTAECVAPLLQIYGQAVVSEPPGGAPWRWPAEGLHMLGMAAMPAVTAEGASYQVLVQERRCPERYPRRVGVPAKRPLF